MYNENNKVVTFLYTNRTIKFTTDNEVIIRIVSPQGFTTVLQGQSAYGDHWDRILIDVTDSETNESIISEWAIKRLSKDELFAEEYTAGRHYRYELEPL